MNAQGDVLLAPNFGDRMDCVLAMMQVRVWVTGCAGLQGAAADLSPRPTQLASRWVVQPLHTRPPPILEPVLPQGLPRGGRNHSSTNPPDDESSGDTSPCGSASPANHLVRLRRYRGPDFASSMYDPGMVPATVAEVMRLYERQQQHREQEGKQVGKQEERRATEEQAGEGGSARLTLVPNLWSWGSQVSVVAWGCVGGDVPLDIEHIVCGTSGSATRIPLRAAPPHSIMSQHIHTITTGTGIILHVLQGLLYSAGVRRSVMAHYRELMAGCAPQDGLQDIELVGSGWRRTHPCAGSRKRGGGVLVRGR